MQLARTGKIKKRKLNGVSKMKKPSVFFAMIALVSGVAALPVAAFVNMLLGLAMLSLPVLLVYQASKAPHE